jgi:tetratricopeptide (TPR) repeat protein
MKSVLVCGAFAIWFLAAEMAHAQAPSSDSFEELARRAEASLDSQPAEAASLYQQALAIRPAWTEGWLYLGAALYQSDRYAEATDAFRKGVSLAPGNGTAWAFLGLCEAELDNPEQALADIRKGEELGLGSNRQFEVAVRIKATKILLRSSSFDEAFAQLQPLANGSENSPAVVETMGLCVLATPQAISELSEQRRAVVRLAGKAAWALVSQRPKEAEAAYQQLLAQYPNEPGVHYAYSLYRMETDVSAALAEFQKELQNNPKHWPARVLMASLQIRQGAPDLAIQSLKEALKVVPPKYRWLCHAELGRANLTAGYLEAAIGELGTAVRLAPSNARVRFFLSQAYRRAGRAEDARRETAEFQKLKAQQDPLGVPSFLPFANPAGKK